MAQPMSFQSLNFGDIPGQEREARKRYYDSLGSIGGVISSTGDKVDDYLQRKQREAEDKKKWDNMIAQQEYQKEQDRLNREHTEEREAIEDARVLRDWKLKQEELRKKTYKDMNNAAALEKYREGLKKSYTPEFLEKYGPTAQADYEAAMTAPTLAEAVASGRNLGQGIYQKDMMDFQREQANLDRVPNKSVTQINDSLSREGIDLRTIPKKVNEKKQRVVDADKVQRQIDVIEEQIRKLEALEPNDNVSAKRTELLRFKSILQDALIPGYKEPTPTLADLLVSR